jgi:hypothetical protein
MIYSDDLLGDELERLLLPIADMLEEETRAAIARNQERARAARVAYDRLMKRCSPQESQN